MGEGSNALELRSFSNLKTSDCVLTHAEPLWKRKSARLCAGAGRGGARDAVFACVSMAEKGERKEFEPTAAQLLKHPVALVAYVPKEAALFAAGAIAGAAAKSFTAPLDRIKLLMQVFLYGKFLTCFTRFFAVTVRGVSACAFAFSVCSV